MKKYIFALVFIFLIQPYSKADVTPNSSNIIKYGNIGIIRINTEATIYEKQNKKSKVVQKIYWDNTPKFSNTLNISEYRTFMAFMPKKDYAFLSVEDDDENNWYSVCYDKEKKLYGWIQEGKEAKFYSWADFILKFGKENGIYFLDSKIEHNLYAKPEEDAQVIDTWTYAKMIQPWFVNGNWMIVKLIDYDNNQKTGYIRWRSDDGKPLIFIKFR